MLLHQNIPFIKFYASLSANIIWTSWINFDQSWIQATRKTSWMTVSQKTVVESGGWANGNNYLTLFMQFWFRLTPSFSSKHSLISKRAQLRGFSDTNPSEKCPRVSTRVPTKFTRLLVFHSETRSPLWGVLSLWHYFSTNIHILFDVLAPCAGSRDFILNSVGLAPCSMYTFSTLFY